MTVVEADHLGGYVPGGDDATFYPDLWRWLVDGPLAVRSVLDVGCGDGVALRFFRDLGCRVLGVDGVPQDDPDILAHDFTRGRPAPGGLSGQRYWHGEGFDLVWCCEFVEHVEERYVPNFLHSFQLARLVLMTHADPDQPGHHHVNCRPADYWVGVLAAAGYRLDADLTGVSRAIATTNPSPWNHFTRSGLAFARQAPH